MLVHLDLPYPAPASSTSESSYSSVSLHQRQRRAAIYGRQDSHFSMPFLLFVLLAVAFDRSRVVTHRTTNSQNLPTL